MYNIKFVLIFCKHAKLLVALISCHIPLEDS